MRQSRELFWKIDSYTRQVMSGKGNIVSADEEPFPDDSTHARNFIDCVLSTSLSLGEYRSANRLATTLRSFNRTDN
jgi:hypothetical protein